MAQEERKADKHRMGKLVETLAAFPQLNPNPLLQVDFSGQITFHNKAAAKVLEEMGLSDLTDFLPADLAAIIDTAGQGQETWFYREVRLGDRIFGEDLHVHVDFKVLRIYSIDITELKSAQEELRRHRDHLEEEIREATAALREKEEALERLSHRQTLILDSIWEGILGLDMSGCIIFANASAAKMLGYEEQELLGLRLDEEGPFYQAVMKAESFCALAEDFFQRQDGTPLPVEFSATPIMEKGKVIGAVVTFRDVSRRRERETELQRLRHHRDLLLNSAWEGIIGLDLNENITFVNRAAAKMLGYEIEELLGRHCHATWHHSKPDGSPYLAGECPILSGIKTGKAHCGVDEVFWRQDGTCFTVEYSLAPMINDVLSGAVLSFRDISRRREAEALAKSLIETSPLGVYLLQNGNFVLANRWFYTITGYGKEDLEHLDFWGLVHPDDRFAVRANAIRMLKGESFTPYEYRHISKGGEVRWIMETVTPISYRGKQATLGYFMDITERKQLEDKLLHAQKMEAVGRLAGGVAHDFNNMLTAIMGYVELMSAGLRRDDPLHRQVRGIEKATERAAALTRQLLAFSRKQILQPQVLNLNAVVRDTEDMLRRLIGEDIELTMVLDPALENVKADPGQIEQVIMNLAINARDAMPTGGRLNLETANVTFAEPHDCKFEIALPGSYVMLAVRDTGVGIAPEMQEHLFEPFYTTKEMGKGTGLGLSTVYGIVKQSDGCIEVQTQAGVGTTFKIYLPRVEEATAPVAAAPPTRLEGSETILVVEDEDMVRQLIADALKMYGYQVLTAGNGGEALLVCERHPEPIHLMVTDVVMPQMCGRDLADRLAPLHPEMQVLYMSGYTEDVISHRGILEEGRLFLQKPFTPAVLAKKVRQALEAKTA